MLALGIFKKNGRNTMCAGGEPHLFGGRVQYKICNTCLIAHKARPSLPYIHLGAILVEFKGRGNYYDRWGASTANARLVKKMVAGSRVTYILKLCSPNVCITTGNAFVAGNMKQRL